MNKSSTIFTVLIFFTTSISMADMMSVGESSSAKVSSSILSKQNMQTVQKSDPIELQKIIVQIPQKQKILLPIDRIAKSAPAVNDPIAMALAEGHHYTYGRDEGIISSVSPGYTVRKGFLQLSKVMKDRRKASIMFVFLMNKDKENTNKPAVRRDHMRSYLHILGPKRLFTDQKLIENEYPMDVSVAKYDDGYAAEEWNLILPNKKPREVDVALMWRF